MMDGMPNVARSLILGSLLIVSPLHAQVPSPGAGPSTSGGAAATSASAPAATPTAIAPAGSTPLPFPEWLQGVREEALARGISPGTVESALRDITPVEQILQRDRSQAEFKETLDQYIARRVGVPTIRLGRQMRTTHAAVLDKVVAQYKVPSEVLVAVWGLESNFGAFTGVRPTVQALATLAFDGRRGELFKNELFDALRIVERGHADLDGMKGSWAGAMGQPQFMPSSYLKYAEDFDGDGRRDIWTSEADVFASIANYLKAYGWDEDATWGRQVRLPGPVADAMTRAGSRGEGCRAERALSQRRLLADWQDMGVRAADGGPLPKLDRQASLLDAGDRQFLVYANYEAILGYNCAHAYALSVAMLGDRIAAQP